MKDKLPTYHISIDPELSEDGEKLGISQIAYTSTPAIITKGVAFNKDEIKKLIFKDNLKYRVAAPILIPDMEIYREDDDLGPYQVVFTKEVIEQLYEDFMLNKGKAAFNLDHDSTKEAPSFILESWLTGPSETDKSFTKYGITVPEGSVFVVSQFTDRDYFKREIIEKDRTGYSIEGFLGLALTQIKKLKQAHMGKTKLEAVKRSNGEDIYVDGELAVDSYVYCNRPSYLLIDNVKSELKYPLWENIVELEDGNILTITDGKIVEITKKENAETLASKELNKTKETMSTKQKFMKAVLKDGTVLFISKMEVGGDATVIDENGDRVPLMDGDHMLEDDSMIVTVDGKITEIKPKAEAEMDDAAVTPATMDDAAVMALVQPKFDELYKLIAELKTLIETDEVVTVDEDEYKEEKQTARQALASFFNATKPTE